jgi:hypothetical protein
MASAKAKKLVEDLKRYGEGFGLAIRSNVVVIIGPPDLRSVPLMPYNEEDLAEAAKEKLIHKTTWSVANHTGKAWNLEVYVAPRESKD